MFGKGCVAVITGAGRLNGVGAATAKMLANQGCHILLNTNKNEEQARSVLEKCQQYGVETELFLGDLTKSDNCSDLASLAYDKWGRTDIIVNSLGATKGAPYEKLEKLTEQDFQHMFAVNAIAPYLVAQSFQPLLRDAGNAAMVNVSSAAGISGKGSSIAYAAAKGAENTLTLSLAQALSPEVRVNAVCPSFIDSSWWEEKFQGKEAQYEKLVSSMQNSNLLNKVLKPNDVAQMIISVINNPVMSGEIIRMDAGAHVGKANAREQDAQESQVGPQK